MNKIGLPNYLSNDKESLIVASDDIEGGHGLHLDSNSILDQLHCVIKAVKFCCSNNDIINMLPLKYFCQVVNLVNEKENEHEIQTKIHIRG